VVALLVGLMAGGALGSGLLYGAKTETGYAEAQIILDTPKPLAVDLKVSDDTIVMQSALLAEHLQAPEQMAALAREAGVPRDGLTVITLPYVQLVPTELARRATRAASEPAKYTLTVTPSPTVPIVSLVATAPDKPAAARVAQSVLPVLRAFVAANGPVAVRGRSVKPRVRALSVKPLGPVRATEIAGGGPKPVVVLVAFVVLFALWCSAIVISSGLMRAWRGLAGDVPPTARA